MPRRDGWVSSALRPRQDEIRAARSAREVHLRVLPCRQPLLPGRRQQCVVLPCTGRRAPRAVAAPTAAVATPRPPGRRHEVRSPQGDGISRSTGAHSSLDVPGLPQDREPEGPVAEGLRRLPSRRRRTRHALRRGLREVPRRHPAWKPADVRPHTRRQVRAGRPHAKLDCHACHTAPVADAEARHGLRLLPSHARRALRPARHRLRPVPRTRELAQGHRLRPRPDAASRWSACTWPCRATPATRQPSFKGAPQDCNDCHQRDDRHKGSLGKDCESCHSPNGWGIWEFDHAKATGFALTGAHARATCDGCHQQPPDVVKLARRLRILPHAGRRAPRPVRAAVPALPQQFDLQGRAPAMTREPLMRKLLVSCLFAAHPGVRHGALAQGPGARTSTT